MTWIVQRTIYRHGRKPIFIKKWCETKEEAIRYQKRLNVSAPILEHHAPTKKDN